MGMEQNPPADHSAEIQHAPKAKRTYRDAIFRAYFSEPENFIPLGEFLIRRPIKPETAALNTIDDVLFSSPRNDVSFRVGDESFTLFEQQSSVNYNMPLRLFLSTRGQRKCKTKAISSRVYAESVRALLRFARKF
ncbi:MAG: hypothetical protein IJS96_10795 [Schwartzia sp.]|nr:hypothetical protein [Schwartzia sp. (in: firmicutes)]